MTTQANRAIRLHTALADDVLLPREVTGRERFSEPFRYDLRLLSEQADIDPDEVLGKTVCLSYQLPSGGGTRYFHGFVTEFGQVGFRHRFHEFEAVVRPWFWLLTRTADCRIFQQRSVPEIFQEVCKSWGFTDYELKLGGSYPQRDYCVQYRETDFDFLSRLLEQEGIYYYFEHGAASHVMVLADDASAHQAQAGYETVPFYPPGTPDARRERDHLSAWAFNKSVQSGAYATTDFDFKQPRASLLSTEAIGRKHPQSSFEIFDYPAALAVMKSNESSRIARLRIQELQASHMILRGHGDAAGLATGRRFKLSQYPRKDLNIEYLIVGIGLSFSSDAYDTGAADAQVEFSCSVEAIDARTAFRPARVTPKPVVHGTQTAMVVGPKGEEIYTDEHARVKVQFHWDRHGKVDENSSCWIRVSQMWAGKGWGALHIPRVGQEVIVSFMDGDPDRPIVTGRVYNGDSKSPYDLPANKTQSGIKSRSSKDGGAAHFNEIRFEDKKGAEQLYIHAEKNQDSVVENDETHSVGHDRSKEVGNDETTHVKRNRTENVDHDESITIGGRRIEKVARDETITIGGVQTLSVDKDQRASISSNQSVTVGEARTISVGKDDALQVGKNLTITAADSITFKTGSASITMKKDGSIAIKGKDISIDGSGRISAKASGDIVMKGGKILQN